MEHDWEQPFLENSDDLIFKNTPRDIAHVLTEMGEKRGARFEFECYDVGHLYMLRHFVDRGLVSGPIFLQFVFGVLGGIGPDPENLDHMKRIADKLFGDSYQFSVLAAGRHQMPLATMWRMVSSDEDSTVVWLGASPLRVVGQASST